MTKRLTLSLNKYFNCKEITVILKRKVFKVLTEFSAWLKHKYFFFKKFYFNWRINIILC